MNGRTFGAFALGVAAALSWPLEARAGARAVADLETTPLTLRRSVIHELSGGVLFDPYDELLMRPYNLGLVNIERRTALGPWPGDAGEQNRYADLLVGNNGAVNVRNGADTIQGSYIEQSMERITWALSGAYLTDETVSSDSVAGSAFSDGDKLSAFDFRAAGAWRVTNRMVLGGGVSVFDHTDEVGDASFEPGEGGFFSLQRTEQSGVGADFGLRWFSGEEGSWEARVAGGSGDIELDDFSETLDDAGAITDRFVVNENAISQTWVELSGGHERRFLEDQGGVRFRAGVRQTERKIDNRYLAYSEDATGISPTLELLGQEPVTRRELFASADTLFVRGWTQIFAGVRVSSSVTDGATQADSLGTVVTESVDDSATGLTFVVGLRQPMWNERFRLVARARADYSDTSLGTSNDAATTETSRKQTTTGYAIGIETVLNNMVFDLAWLFGGDPAPGGVDEARRQTIDVDRLVISATFGW